MDEASTEGPTRILEVWGQELLPAKVLVPRELGIPRPSRDVLLVKDRAEALRLAVGLHGGARHPDYRQPLADAVALQAGLAMVLVREQELSGLQEALLEARAGVQQGFDWPFPISGGEDA